MSEEPTEEIVEEAIEQDDLRSSLEDAYVEEDAEDSTTEEEATPSVAEEATPSATEETTPEGLGDGKGESIPADINAPLGFSPESRESWKDVPSTVKQEIQRREREITEAMSNTADARRTHSGVNELANRYATILAAEGAESPMAAIEGLFRTVSELRVGSPQQVATKMATLIGHYGVDIGMLDSALSGQSVQPTEQSNMQQMLDQKLAPFQAMLDNQQNSARAQEHATQQAVGQELETFAQGAEFLNDVRHDMADLIDLASKRGLKMSFEDAYAKACALDPRVSEVMRSRESAQALQNSGQKLASKRNVSSSIRSGGVANSAASAPQDLRGELAALWDSASE